MSVKTCLQIEVRTEYTNDYIQTANSKYFLLNRDSILLFCWSPKSMNIVITLSTLRRLGLFVKGLVDLNLLLELQRAIHQIISPYKN